MELQKIKNGNHLAVDGLLSINAKASTPEARSDELMYSPSPQPPPTEEQEKEEIAKRGKDFGPNSDIPSNCKTLIIILGYLLNPDGTAHIWLKQRIERAIDVYDKHKRHLMNETDTPRLGVTLGSPQLPVTTDVTDKSAQTAQSDQSDKMEKDANNVTDAPIDSKDSKNSKHSEESKSPKETATDSTDAKDSKHSKDSSSDVSGDSVSGASNGPDETSIDETIYFVGSGADLSNKLNDYKSDHPTESQFIAKYLETECNIDSAHILYENKAAHTADNFIQIFKMLHKSKFCNADGNNLDYMFIITSNFHVNRTKLLFETLYNYIDPKTKEKDENLVWCNVKNSIQFVGVEKDDKVGPKLIEQEKVKCASKKRLKMAQEHNFELWKWRAQQDTKDNVSEQVSNNSAPEKMKIAHIFDYNASNASKASADASDADPNGKVKSMMDSKNGVETFLVPTSGMKSNKSGQNLNETKSGPYDNNNNNNSSRELSRDTSAASSTRDIGYENSMSVYTQESTKTDVSESRKGTDIVYDEGKGQTEDANDNGDDGGRVKKGTECCCIVM